MSVAVNVNRIDFAQKANASWGEAPEWVAQLAAEANRTGLKATAKRIGYSDGTISMVLAAKYAGDLGKVEAAVRGALMGETVDCPVMGEIRRDHCLQEQSMPLTNASPLRSLIFRACRSGCPHSRLKGADDVAD